MQRLDTVIQPNVLCVFDFDGTLAPIVAQPDAALLPAPVRERLLRLQRLTPVAILTGRALADIANRLHFEADYMVGNHGLEGLPDSDRRRAGFEHLCRRWHATLHDAFSDTGRFSPSIMLEDKTLSLSVHYRHASDQVHAQAQLLQLFSTLIPAPRIIAGKCVFNLLPEDAGDKGTAFDQLMVLAGAASAVYVGDDVTDEDVFGLMRPDLLSIRVGDTDDSAAEFFVDGHADILLVLDAMIGRLTTNIARK